MTMLKGNMNVSRYDETKMTIEIEDALSHTRFLVVHTNPRDLMMAITGRGHVPMEFELNAGRVGLVHESKHEMVEVKDFTYGLKVNPVVKKLVKALEVEGWQASMEDTINPHNFKRDDGKKLVKVRFVRWVKEKRDAEAKEA